MSAIDALIRQKEAEMVSIKSQPRRSCSIPDPFRTSPDVLGQVCVCVCVCVCGCVRSFPAIGVHCDLLEDRCVRIDDCKPTMKSVRLITRTLLPFYWSGFS